MLKLQVCLSCNAACNGMRIKPILMLIGLQCEIERTAHSTDDIKDCKTKQDMGCDQM